MCLAVFVEKMSERGLATGVVETTMSLGSLEITVFPLVSGLLPIRGAVVGDPVGLEGGRVSLGESLEVTLSAGLDLARPKNSRNLLRLLVVVAELSLPEGCASCRELVIANQNLLTLTKCGLR